MAKRERTKTRADMIALLKSRGVRGRLSKMTKAQLRDKLHDTEPKNEDQEGDGKPVHHKSGELELDKAVACELALYNWHYVML